MSDYRSDISLLDALTLDGAPSTAPAGPADAFSYAGFGLQNANVITEKVVVSPPANALVERAVARADGSYAETSYSRRTVISISGALKADSVAGLDALMDQVSQAMATRGGTFRMTRNGVPRYYENCQPQALEGLFAGRQSFHATWIPFEAQLACLTPFARSESRESLAVAGPATAAQTTYVVVNGGTARSAGQWTFTVTTAGTLSALTLANATTGETITVSATFRDGDYLTVDGEARTVYLNGVPADYSGVIPSLLPGSNAFTLTPAGAGFSIGVNVRHYSRWL